MKNSNTSIFIFTDILHRWCREGGGLGPVCFGFKSFVDFDRTSDTHIWESWSFSCLVFIFILERWAFYLFDKQVFVGWVPELRLTRAWLWAKSLRWGPDVTFLVDPGGVLGFKDAYIESGSFKTSSGKRLSFSQECPLLYVFI